MTTNRTARLTIPARQLRRGDRITNLVPGAVVVAFDLEIGTDTVDVWPSQAGLDAGLARRYAAPAAELMVIDRELDETGAPAQPAVVAPRPVVDVEAVAGRATAGTLREAVAALAAAPAGSTAAARRELLEAELARRAADQPAHTYTRQERDDAVRMVCTCGKRSRWGTYATASAAAERHADETARAAR